MRYAVLGLVRTPIIISWRALDEQNIFCKATAYCSYQAGRTPQPGYGTVKRFDQHGLSINIKYGSPHIFREIIGIAVQQRSEPTKQLRLRDSCP